MIETTPTPAEVERLEAFFDYLRGQGFATGIGERLRAHRVTALGGQKPRPERLKTLLCPVFARDAEEQERFDAAFDLYFTPARPGLPPAWRADAAPVSPPPDREPREDVKWRRNARRLAGVAVGLSAAMAALLWWDAPGRVQRWVAPPLEPVIDTPPRAGLFRAVQEKVRRLELRRCRGVECVSRGYRPGVILSPLAAYALYEMFRRSIAYRRRQVRQRLRERTPPLEWPVRGPVPPLVALNRGFLTAARLLRKRLSGDLRLLDLPATIDASARQAGFVELRYRQEQRPPEYLFLIDRRSHGDHVAAWFDTLARELENQGVRLARWFFDRDPRLCESAETGEVCSLARLAEVQGKTRLVLFTAGEGLLSRFRGELAAWIRGRAFGTFESPVVLTPVPAFEWGRRETALGRHFAVFPAKIEHCADLVAHFESPLRPAGERRFDRQDYPIPPPSYLELRDDPLSELLPPLASFFEPQAFRWLCACAVHHELRWELTLRLARLVDPSGRLLEERTLLPLIRLPWFRQGEIPREWRTRLIQCLDTPTRDAARQTIIELIERDRAPEGSFAYDRQQATIAAQRYWLEPDNPRRRVELEMALAGLPLREIAEDALLEEVVEAWRTGPRAAWRQSAREGWERFRQIGLRRAVAMGLLSVMAVLWLWQVQVRDQREDTITRYVTVEAPGRLPATGPPTAPPPPSAPEARVEQKASPKPWMPPARQERKGPARQIEAPPPAVAVQPGPQVQTPLPSLTPPLRPPEAKTPSPTQARISGFVADATGAAVPGATIRLRSSPTGAMATTVTNNEGTYSSPPLRPGSYTIEAESLGFKRAMVEVTVKAGDSLQVNIPLQVGALASSLRVKVIDHNGDDVEGETVVVRQGSKEVVREPANSLRAGLGWDLPDGKYQVEVLVPSGRRQALDLVVSNKSGPVTVLFTFFTDPNKVEGARFPRLGELSPDLQQVLATSRSLGTAYPELLENQPKAAAGLLNLYVKMKSVRLEAGRDCFSYLTELRMARQDRILALVRDTGFYDAVRASSRFRAVPGALHPNPSGFRLLGSFKTYDKEGVLQLTFFADGSQMLVDADIDETSSLFGNFVRVLGRSVSGSITDPYLIHQLLLSQGIRPLYRLEAGGPGPSRSSTIRDSAGDPVEQRGPQQRAPKAGQAKQ